MITAMSSNQFLLLLGLLLAVPVVVVAVLNWSFRSQGGIAKGWGGALFIGLCWIATVALILQRVAM
jgi:hypothetical protein